MEEQGLAKLGLSFSQKIKKKLYLLNMNEKKATKYFKLSNALQNDEDIIKATFNANPSMINEIDVKDDIIMICKKEPHLLNLVSDFDVKKHMIREDPNLIQYLSENDIIKFYKEYAGGITDLLEIFVKGLKYLSEDIKYKILRDEKIEFLDESTGRSDSVYIHKGKIGIHHFPEDLILKIAALEKKGEVFGLGPEYKYSLRKLDMSKLPEEIQIKLLLLDNEYKNVVSKETIEKFVGNNPLLFEMLPKEIIDKKIAEGDIDFIQALKGNHKQMLDEKGVPRKITGYNDVPISGASNVEEAKSMYMKHNGITMEGIYEMNEELIKEMVRLCPQESLKIPNMDMSLNTEQIEILKLFCNENAELLEYLNENKERLGRAFIKLATNDDIMQAINDPEKNIDARTLIEYMEQPTNDRLANIVENVYGSKSAQIVRDRPRINMDVIPNMYIFHPDIVDEFSIGATHATISYKMKVASAEFSEFARDPKKFEEYKRFNKLTEGLFEDTAVDLENKLLAFEYSRDILGELQENALSSKQIGNLTIAIRDLLAFRNDGPLTFPKNIQELEEYSEKRSKFFDEAVLKLTDGNAIKECIAKRFFGMPYYDKEYTGIDMAEVCRIYNIGEFINDGTTVTSGEFSQDELDFLEAMDIFSSITDVRCLQELSMQLSKHEKEINPLKTKQLLDKVHNQYSQVLINKLITPGKAEEMIREGMPGISMREKDGVKIITLSGVDFVAYITNPYMNNSSMGPSTNFDAGMWREYENGITTFSGCLTDQTGTPTTVEKGEIGLGISSIKPNQIAAMSPTDAHVSHSKRTLDFQNDSTVRDSLNYLYPDELLEVSNKRINAMDGDKSYKLDERLSDRQKRFIEGFIADLKHRYNEIAAARRIQELSQVQPGTYGGKIMPDYIYANGRGVGDKGIELAKQFGIQYILEYDDEANKDYARPVHKTGEKVEVKREKSNFIKSITNIRERDGYDR